MMAKSLAEQYAGKCIHFNGVMNKACKAGVDYDTFPKPGPIPCFADATNAPACALCHFPTPEEVQAYVERMEAHRERRRENNALIGAAHAGVSGPSRVFVCELCERPTRYVTQESSEMVIHLVDQHGIEETVIRAAKGGMDTHMDARDWFQTDDRFTLPDGRVFLTRSTRQPRRGADKAVWADAGRRRR